MITTFVNLSAPPSRHPPAPRGQTIIDNDTLILDPQLPDFTEDSPPSFIESSRDLAWVHQDIDDAFYPGETSPDVKKAVSSIELTFSSIDMIDFDIGRALKGVALVSNSGGKATGSETGKAITEKLQAEVKNELAQEVTGTLQAGAKNEVNAENKAKQKAVRSISRRVSSSGSSSSRSSSGRSGGRRVTQPTKHVCGPRCNH